VTFAGRSVLVTGGLGFIGSAVARALAAAGADVAVLDALTPGDGGDRRNVEDVKDRIAITIGDVRDDAVVRELVRGRSHVFHLAGQVSHVDAMEDPRADLGKNTEASIALLEACRRTTPRPRVVFASTRQVYGRARRLPLDEEHPCEPVDANGIHKWAAERHHLLYDQVLDVPSVCLRLTNTYGPGQLVRHARQGFIGWFVRKVVERSTIEVMGDGAQLRDLNHVDDVVDAMLRAAASDARGVVWNLGAEPMSIRAIAELLVEIRGAGTIRFVPFPEERLRIDVGSAHASWERIRRAIGWEPRVPLRDGLASTIRHYDAHLARYLP